MHGRQSGSTGWPEHCYQWCSLIVPHLQLQHPPTWFSCPAAALPHTLNSDVNIEMDHRIAAYVYGVNLSGYDQNANPSTKDQTERFWKKGWQRKKQREIMDC
jgi:hypothetical protein